MIEILIIKLSSMNRLIRNHEGIENGIGTRINWHLTSLLWIISSFIVFKFADRNDELFLHTIITKDCVLVLSKEISIEFLQFEWMINLIT